MVTVAGSFREACTLNASAPFIAGVFDIELGDGLGTDCASSLESDGFNCDMARSTCGPAPEPTCAELETELECVGRGDCVPIYAGVGCSCGVDCTCKGGEPGCVCQSFEFFRCDAS